MAKVAPLLDIELVELDRASCCGAGVIAEHNQELADTLNARTFALAQQEIGGGAGPVVKNFSTRPGPPSQGQESPHRQTGERRHTKEKPAPPGRPHPRR